MDQLQDKMMPMMEAPGVHLRAVARHEAANPKAMMLTVEIWPLPPEALEPLHQAMRAAAFQWCRDNNLVNGEIVELPINTKGPLQ